MRSTAIRSALGIFNGTIDDVCDHDGLRPGSRAAKRGRKIRRSRALRKYEELLPTGTGCGHIMRHGLLYSRAWQHRAGKHPFNKTQSITVAEATRSSLIEGKGSRSVPLPAD
jgi:hypothetical protein